MAAQTAREKIVMAAMELFWLKGYNSTSVADLLSRTQLNSGSLYHVFPSKQDVLIGVLEAYRDGIEEMLLAPAWAGVDDPIEKIFALLKLYRTMIVETDCTYGCPIGSLALELHEPDPQVRELIAVNFENWTKAIEGCLSAAGKRLPSKTDKRALAQFVLTAMEGGVMQARTHRDVAYFDRAVAQLRAHFDMLESMANQKRGRDASAKGESMELNWLAIIVAALSSFPLGFLWYGPLFGKAWAAEVGMTDEKAKAGNPAVTFGGAFVLALIQASTFAMFLGPVRNPEAALYGLCAGLCWVGAAFGVQYLFERKSVRLGLINAGYNAVAFTLIGAIIGAWR